VYSDLEVALKNAGDVTCLVLRSKGYRVFPKQILEFSNLECLDLRANYITFQDTLPSADTLTPLSRRSYDIFIPLHGSENPNTFEKIPKGIRKLNKLKKINLLQTGVTEKEIRKLKRRVPKGCEIIYLVLPPRGPDE
jgi:hypothetical protein